MHIYDEICWLDISLQQLYGKQVQMGNKDGYSHHSLLLWGRDDILKRDPHLALQ